MTISDHGIRFWSIFKALHSWIKFRIRASKISFTLLIQVGWLSWKTSDILHIKIDSRRKMVWWQKNLEISQAVNGTWFCSKLHSKKYWRLQGTIRAIKNYKDMIKKNEELQLLNHFCNFCGENFWYLNNYFRLHVCLSFLTSVGESLTTLFKSYHKMSLIEFS